MPRAPHARSLVNGRIMSGTLPLSDYGRVARYTINGNYESRFLL